MLFNHLGYFIGGWLTGYIFAKCIPTICEYIECQKPCDDNVGTAIEDDDDD